MGEENNGDIEKESNTKEVLNVHDKHTKSEASTDTKTVDDHIEHTSLIFSMA